MRPSTEGKAYDVQVLAKLPMTTGMLKVSGLLPMLQQAVKELQEHSPAREPAVRTLQKWRALLRPPSATSHPQLPASPVVSLPCLP